MVERISTSRLARARQSTIYSRNLKRMEKNQAKKYDPRSKPIRVLSGLPVFNLIFAPNESRSSESLSQGVETKIHRISTFSDQPTSYHHPALDEPGFIPTQIAYSGEIPQRVNHQQEKTLFTLNGDAVVASAKKKQQSLPIWHTFASAFLAQVITGKIANSGSVLHTATSTPKGTIPVQSRLLTAAFTMPQKFGGSSIHARSTNSGIYSYSANAMYPKKSLFKRAVSCGTVFTCYTYFQQILNHKQVMDVNGEPHLFVVLQAAALTGLIKSCIPHNFPTVHPLRQITGCMLYFGTYESVKFQMQRVRVKQCQESKRCFDPITFLVSGGMAGLAYRLSQSGMEMIVRGRKQLCFQLGYGVGRAMLLNALFFTTYEASLVHLKSSLY